MAKAKIQFRAPNLDGESIPLAPLVKSCNSFSLYVYFNPEAHR